MREPDALRRYLVPQYPDAAMADLITVEGGARADLHMLETGRTLPLAGTRPGNRCRRSTT